MRKSILGPPLAAVALLAGAPALASSYVSVMSTDTSPILLTALAAGTTYHITTTGSSNLLNGGQLDFDANGVPLHEITNQYSSLYPNGGYTDPTSGAYGVAGANGKLGSLIGTFTATPTSAADFFEIGSDYTFTSAINGSLYAMVNDVSSAYSDNQAGIGFKVVTEIVGGGTGSPGGVPEPATWALMISGFGMVGATLRRRSAKVVAG